MHKSAFYHEGGGEPTTYTAACHCKAIRYRVTVPSLDTIPAGSCNCSFCSMTAMLGVMAWRDDIVLEQGEDKISTYKWGKGIMQQKFCSVCSTNLFCDHEGHTMPGIGDVSGYVAVNVGDAPAVHNCS